MTDMSAYGVSSLAPQEAAATSGGSFSREQAEKLLLRGQHPPLVEATFARDSILKPKR